jgi:hypothetical protein
MAKALSMANGEKLAGSQRSIGSCWRRNGVALAKAAKIPS